MRTRLWLTVILAGLAMPAMSVAQQAQSGQGAQQSQQQSKTQAKAQASQKDSLAQAARKAREKEKTAPKAPMVFTNDNIPTAGGGVSVVGAQPAAAKESGEGATAAESKAAPEKNNNDEAKWRKQFADARQKIAQDEQALSIMQRELGELNVQYYPDPTKALKQSVDRSDIIKKTEAIAAKQKELDADKQALSNLEDQLRAAGGDPGWARP